MTDFAAPIHRRLTARAPEPPRAEANARHDWRLMLLILAFLLFYAAVAGRMAWMALSDPVEPRLGATSPAEPVRGAITDRAGRLIAANLPAWSLYAHPSDVLSPVETAARLGEILPDMEADEILALLTSRRKFVWIKRPITPRQKAAIQDLGNPGLLFGARDLRLYPPGPEVAHVVGGVQAEREAVRYAALRGQGGVERFFDRRLSDPALSGEPLALSLDLSVQAALRDVLETERRRTSAIGAAGVLMRVQTGEVIAWSRCRISTQPAAARAGPCGRQEPAFQPRGAGALRARLGLQAADGGDGAGARAGGAADADRHARPAARGPPADQ